MVNGSGPTEYGIRLLEFTNAVSNKHPPAALLALPLELDTPPFVIFLPLFSVEL